MGAHAADAFSATVTSVIVPDVGKRAGLTLLCVLATLALGWLDLVTGPHWDLTLFYLVPIVAAGWFLGSVPGLMLAFAATFAWLAADVAVRDPQLWAASLWNGASRFVIFAASVALMAQLRAERVRLEAMNRQRADFLRVLERELPAPVEAIGAAARRLASARDGSARDEALREVLRRVQDASFVTREFVALGHLQSRDVTLRRQIIDLNELVGETVREIGERDRITLVVQSGGVRVDADPDRMRQAIGAVLGTALRHSREYVSVTVRSVDERAEVDVSDRGLRVDPIELESLFGGRLPLDDPRRLALKERVLGLQLARVLVEAHGGSLAILRDGAPGRSTVRVTLPAAPVQPQLASVS
jgi:signal transduction histidine kinase